MPRHRTQPERSFSDPNPAPRGLATSRRAGSSPDTPAGKKPGRRRALVVSARLWVDGVEVMADTFSFRTVPWHPAVTSALVDIYERAR